MRVGYYLLNFKSEADIITLSDQIEIRKIISSFQIAESEVIEDYYSFCPHNFQI